MRGLIQILKADLKHRPGRKLLSIGIVAVGIAFMVALMGGIGSLEKKIRPISAGMDAGADLIVMHGSGSYDMEAMTNVLERRTEVSWLLPRNSETAYVHLAGELRQGIVFAVDAKKEQNAGLLELTKGTLPLDGDPGILMREDIALAAGLQIGDRVNIYMADGRHIEWPLIGLLGPKGVGGANGFFSIVISRSQASLLNMPVAPEKILIGMINNEKEAKERFIADISPELKRNGLFAEEPPEPFGLSLGLVLFYVLSLIGPVIGGFLIRNSFEMTVRERIRELSLLHVLGATRRQLIHALIVEGIFVGFVGSLIGIGAGVFFIRVAVGLIMGMGTDVTNAIIVNEIHIPLWMLGCSLLIGVALTLFAVIKPALHLSRESSLHDTSRNEDFRTFRFRTRHWIWTVLLVLSFVSMIVFPNQALSLLFSLVFVLALLVWLPDLVTVIGQKFPMLAGAYRSAISLGIRRTLYHSRRAVGSSRAMLLLTGILVGLYTVSGGTWNQMLSALNRSETDVVLKGYMDDETVSYISSIPGVEQAGRMFRGGAFIGKPGDGHREGSTLWSIEQQQYAPIKLQSGISADASELLQDNDSLLLGSMLAERLDVRAGDRIEMNVGEQSIPMTVAGIVEQQWYEGEMAVWVSKSAISAEVGLIPAQSVLRIANPDHLSELKNIIMDKYPNLSVVTLQDRLDEAKQIYKQKWKSFFLILYAMQACVFFSIIQNGLISMIEQRREIALFRATGGTPLQTLCYALSMLSAPGIVGGLLGAVSGLFLGKQFVSLIAANRGVALSAGLTGWIIPLGVVILLMLLSAIPAFYRMQRVPLGQALNQAEQG